MALRDEMITENSLGRVIITLGLLKDYIAEGIEYKSISILQQSFNLYQTPKGERPPGVSSVCHKIQINQQSMTGN